MTQEAAERVIEVLRGVRIYIMLQDPVHVELLMRVNMAIVTMRLAAADIKAFIET